jgi:hypothetical protein
MSQDPAGSDRDQTALRRSAGEANVGVEAVGSVEAGIVLAVEGAAT